MLRIGLVSYLNTAPLVFGLKRTLPPEWVLVEDHPSRLNQALREGRLDLALVSSLEYAQNVGQYLLLPDVSISATGRVGSVTLFGYKRLEELNRACVVLTSASATSVALLKLLLEDFCGLKPFYRWGTVKEGVREGAYLAIGDEALRLKYQELFPENYDLAALWMEHTGLPFVFAVFAVRKDSWEAKGKAVKAFASSLYLSRARGLATLKTIARRCQGISGLTAGECLIYLKGIEYDLSGLKQEALRVFYEHLLRRKEIKKLPEFEFIDL